MVDQLRAVIATLEKLDELPTEQQKQIAERITTVLKDQQFDTFIASPEGDAFIDGLLDEYKEAKQDGTLTEGGSLNI